MSATARFRVPPALIAGLALVLGLLAVTPAPAAALEPPVIASPADGQAVSGTPLLDWQPVPGATAYDVVISAGTSIGTVLARVDSTVNTQWVPEVALPAGQLTWRVTPKEGTTAGPAALATFTLDPSAGPDLTTPVAGAKVSHPDRPLVFTWTPVAGAKVYDLEIATDPGFTSDRLVPGIPDVPTTTYAPTALLAPGAYYWRVRGVADNGISTGWSDTGSFTVHGLDVPTLVSPADGETVDDIVLDWSPVRGAATYNLQVSTDVDFETIIDTKAGLTSTRYSPTQTYENDQVYWRVQAVDPAGHVSVDLDPASPTFNSPSWSQQRVLRRAWDDQPRLLYPTTLVGQPVQQVGDPLYLQWSPVHLATRYRVQIRTDNTWPADGAGTHQCDTQLTTLSLAMPALDSTFDLRDNCGVTQPGTYYWRVLAYDDPAAWLDNSPVTVSTASSPIQTGWFDYRPGRAVPVAPADGAHVTVPTLSWTPVQGAARYKVTIVRSGGGGVWTRETSATSYTALDRLPFAMDGATPVSTQFRWMVQPISASGQLGLAWTNASQPSFWLDPLAPSETAATADPTSTPGVSGLRIPTVTWQPVTGANEYRLYYRPAGTSTWTPAGDRIYYAAWQEDAATRPTPGTYEFYVEAWKDNAYLGGDGRIGTFRVLPFTQGIVGHRVGLTGNAVTGFTGPEDTCDAGLPANCRNLRSTPVLAWDAPDTAIDSYLVYLSMDAEMTNPVRDPKNPARALYWGVRVTSTMFTPTIVLPDSQAGTAYYWNVVPVISGVAESLDNAAQAFNKQSVPVSLRSPADGAPVSDDITLVWEDFLVTQDGAGTSDTAVTTPGQSEARQYTVQVADNPAFANTTSSADNVWTATVDQPTWTLSTDTYVEGPLYWRVQVVDAYENRTGWSPSRTMTKRSHTPVTGTAGPFGTEQRLTWPALDFAKGYNVEVYRNDDTGANAVNKVTLASAAGIHQPTYALNPQLAPGTYSWRVQRVDAKNRLGAWSGNAGSPAGWGHFTVTASAPVLRTPLDGQEVDPFDSLFVWQPLVGAKAYRFDLARVGGIALPTVTTVATRHAPRTMLATGDWTWKVTALDAAGNALGTSAIQTVRVTNRGLDGRAPTVSGTAQVGGTLSAAPPVWNVDGVTTSYQWLRNGTPVIGRTAPTYAVGTDDAAANVSVRAVGKKTGYADGVLESAPVTVSAGPAAVATEAPTITGTATVGNSLSASRISWTRNGAPVAVSTTWQWLRDGQPIAGATSTVLRLTTADAGRVVSVRASLPQAGYLTGTVTSGGVTVAGTAGTATNVAPRVVSTTPRPSGRIRAGAAVKATFSERVTNVTTRTAVLKLAGRRVTTRVVLSLDGGTVTIKPTRRLKRGKRYTVTLTSGIRDAQGAALTAYSFRFRVR